ncbi:hypothetical protein OPV22_006779 [Ensete ventricosum]|uniref:Uncharacterized protein n=1 Tax=Ensete ventricosum TaxID=4639 RepID=A0AAV8RJN1_ENSVE|nr:hypothetical protein OPV22_006779 [Ensete ventricosum]
MLAPPPGPPPAKPPPPPPPPPPSLRRLIPAAAAGVPRGTAPAGRAPPPAEVAVCDCELPLAISDRWIDIDRKACEN